MLLSTAALVLTGPSSSAAPVFTGARALPQGDARPPNDPLFRYQWNLNALQIPAAWGISRGAGAIVAVLDTGVAYENRGPYRRAPDLAGTRFVPGWDFVDNDAHPDDVPPPDGRRSHGTQIAGLIAQTAGNGIGGAGVAPEATIMPIRVLDPELAGSARNIARGLRFAADHGADVANLSIAGPAGSRVLQEAVAYAAAKGVTMVAATGNDGASSVGWPAAYPQVIAVGAVRQDLTRAAYSNYGKALDLVAPGGAGETTDTGYGPSDGVVAQTLKGGRSAFCFCFMASTSAAAAQVSGVAALLVGAGHATRPAAVRAALLERARDLGAPGRDHLYGAGLVQARDALLAARGPRAGIASPPPPRTPPGPSPGRSWPLGIAGAAAAALAGLVVVRHRHRAR